MADLWRVRGRHYGCLLQAVTLCNRIAAVIGYAALALILREAALIGYAAWGNRR